MIDNLTSGPQILVGSSMGGWIMLLAALARPQRVAGLVGIAAAPDFTADLLEKELTDAQRAQLTRDGYVDRESEYEEEPMRISRHLIDDGNRNLILGGPMNISCPVRLLHGQRDGSVPWQRALDIANHISGDDVEIVLIKDGDHRLSRDRDLALLSRTIDVMAGGGRS